MIPSTSTRIFNIEPNTILLSPYSYNEFNSYLLSLIYIVYCLQINPILAILSIITMIINRNSTRKTYSV